MVVTKEIPRKYDVYRAADRDMAELIPRSVSIQRVHAYPWLDWIGAGKYRRKIITVIFGFPDGQRLWANRCAKQAVSTAQQFRPDIVFTTSPPSVHLVGAQVAREIGCKWVADFQDAWVGNRLVRDVSPLHRWVSHKYYEKVIRDCDLVVANNPWLRSLIAKQFPDLDAKIVSVPIGYDEALFGKAQPHRFTADSTGRIALYSGGIYKVKVLRVLEQLCAHLDERPEQGEPAVRVYAIGQLDHNYRPRHRSGLYGLGYMNYAEVPSYLLGADCLILFMPEAERGSARVLLKSYGYARAQRPILYLGPRNATYEHLEARTTVRQFELSELKDAAAWMKTLPKVNYGQPLHVPDSILIDSFECRMQTLAQILDAFV